MIYCVRIALCTAPKKERSGAIQRVIEVLPQADWFLRTEARNLFLEHFLVARGVIEQEVSRRMQKEKREQALGVVLRLLINTLWQAGGKWNQGESTHAKQDH